MFRIFASLLVIVSLLLPTVAQAADALSADHCEMVKMLNDGHSDGDSDDSHKSDSTGKPFHHHCCAHSITPAVASTHMQENAVSTAPFQMSEEALSSLAFGPPLKPPSRV